MTRNSPTESASRLPTVRLVVTVVLTVLAVVFIVQNDQTVSIRLLIPVVSMPLWVALVAMLLVGAVIGYVVNWRRR